MSLSPGPTGTVPAPTDTDARVRVETADDIVPAPPVGAPAVIVPADGEEPVAGEVTVWSPGLGGLVVTARIHVGVGAAGALSGQRVWVRARGPEAMVVIQAMARQVPGRREEIELTGVQGLAVERRRESLRARLRRSILLLRDGSPSRGTWTVDLSSSGCRVRMAEGQQLEVGDRVQAALTDAAGGTLWLLGETVWVDPERGELGLHFVDVEESDRLALEREVLAWHAERVTTSD